MSKKKRSFPPKKKHAQAPRKGAFSSQATKPSLDSANADHMWLYGWHSVKMAWANPHRQCRRLLLTQNMVDRLPKLTTYHNLNYPPRPQAEIVTAEALNALFPPHTQHQGIALLCHNLAQITLSDLLAEFIEIDSNQPLFVVMLDRVTDPQNIGAIWRNAAAFGAKALIVTDRHAPHPNPFMLKIASGGAELVPLIRVANLAQSLKRLQEHGFWAMGFDSEAPAPLSAQTDLPPRKILLFGAEGAGIRRLLREKTDFFFALPTQAPLQSLNVSHAAAIAMYAVGRPSSPKT